jgi:hypothetical protein
MVNLVDVPVVENSLGGTNINMSSLKSLGEIIRKDNAIGWLLLSSLDM